METQTKPNGARSAKRREIEREALSRAQGNMSTRNYGAIIQGFAERGIPESEIRPRENVFTFHAWRAQGRTVRKGEKGVRVTTWIPADEIRESKRGKPNPRKRKARGGMVPTTAHVFHISQTKPLAGE